jgi:hypothetical protein
MWQKQCETFVKNNIEPHIVKNNIITLSNFMLVVIVSKHYQKRAENNPFFGSVLCRPNPQP